MKKITKKSIEKFKKYLIDEEKSDNTIEKYIRDVNTFANWIDGGEVVKSNVLEYKQKLMENYAPASVNSMLSALNRFFEFIGRFDCKVKFIKIQKQTFMDDEKELTKKDYEKLLDTANKNNNMRLYYLMQTITATGIRISELKFISCEAVNSGQAKISCKGKIRTIILSKELCKVLKQYAKSQNITSGPIFVTKKGKPLNRSNVWLNLKRLCKIAGVSPSRVFPHNFRHLFARTFYSMQKDIVRLADILGHSNVNTTRIYTMETGLMHKKQIQKIGMLFIRI